MCQNDPNLKPEEQQVKCWGISVLVINIIGLILSVIDFSSFPFNIISAVAAILGIVATSMPVCCLGKCCGGNNASLYRAALVCIIITVIVDVISIIFSFVAVGAIAAHEEELKRQCEYAESMGCDRIGDGFTLVYVIFACIIVIGFVCVIVESVYAHKCHKANRVLVSEPAAGAAPDA